MEGLTTQRLWIPTKRRGPIAAEFVTPGPACVTLPPLIGKTMTDSKKGRAPAFTFGGRHLNKNDSPGPGPGQYNIFGLNSKGKDVAPALSLHGRTKSGKIQTTPAPGDYDPQKAEKIVSDNSPKFSFGIKTQVEKVNHTPAPNMYNIPSALGGTKESNIKTAPAFSISGRQKAFTDERIFVPGPGSYESIKPDTVRSKSPAYSISARHQIPNDHSQKPGPGAHCPEKVILDVPPAHSFGIRHSPYICNLKDTAF